METNAKSELAWVALRYVCDELSADEAAAFERRLDQDQDAREALSQAVELAGAVAHLPSELGTVLAMPRRTSLRRWAAMAAAACLLLAFGAWGVWLRPQNADPRGLALAWSGVHEEGDRANDLLEWLDTTPSPADSPYVAALDASDAGVPDWMLEAAALAGAAQAGHKEN